MKELWKILALGIASAVLIWVWILDIDPEPSMSLGIIILVPIVLIINLAIAGVLFLIGKREYVKYFLINSLVSSFLMVFLFGKGVDRNLDRRIDEWKFIESDSTFRISIWTESDWFSITHEINSTLEAGYIDGKYENLNEHWILTTNKDSVKMIINKSDRLINFRSRNDTIELERIR